MIHSLEKVPDQLEILALQEVPHKDVEPPEQAQEPPLPVAQEVNLPIFFSSTQMIAQDCKLDPPLF